MFWFPSENNNIFSVQLTLTQQAFYRNIRVNNNGIMLQCILDCGMYYT